MTTKQEDKVVMLDFLDTNHGYSFNVKDLIAQDCVEYNNEEDKIKIAKDASMKEDVIRSIASMVRNMEVCKKSEIPSLIFFQMLIRSALLYREKG